ncbi:MAG TPA: ABC transporter ATP-binding protein [Anaerolineae bacterium]|jgi:ATP-binding cassette subfamily B protein|nr:ABC transporter ATP-binding protein [Anaerolineae bacterium]
MTKATMAEEILEEGKERPQEKAIDKKSMTGATLKRLTSNMSGGENTGRFVLGVLLRLVALLALVTLPWITGNAMNTINDSGSTDELWRWVSYGVVAGLIFLVMSFLADRTFASLATKALYKLQTDLFKNLQTLSMGFFYRTPVGELLSRITNDAEVVAQYYEQGIAQIIRAVMFILMIIVVMLAINVRLTIAALLIVPVIIASMLVITRIASPAFEKLQEQLGETSGFQEETLAGHKVIISKRRQAWADKVNEANATDVFHVGSKAFFTSLMQFPLTQSLTYVQVVLVYVVGSLMVIGGQTTLGTVTAFAGYVALMASPLSQISNLVSTALNAAAGGERVYHIVDEEPTVFDAPDAVDYQFKGGRIEFKDVDFGYVPGRLILRDNNFDIAPGESIGICGPTGAGKSTIINILTRYYDIDRGQILIDGQDLATLTRESLRKQIGAVLQEAFLFTDTVMNNLKYANADATEEDVIEAAKKANAHDFIMNLPEGYDTLLTERGGNLSQGQRQMITIARAMVADPKIMILDEATSNVDTRTEKLIQDGLRALMEGKTSFSIAHRLATIRDSARIMVVNGGEIVEMASHDELMAKKGFYYALYMSQFKGAAPGGMESVAMDFVST